jgi:hypothetical protein
MVGGVERKERKNAIGFTTWFWICHSLQENKSGNSFYPDDAA